VYFIRLENTAMFCCMFVAGPTMGSILVMYAILSNITSSVYRATLSG